MDKETREDEIHCNAGNGHKKGKPCYFFLSSICLELESAGIDDCEPCNEFGFGTTSLLCVLHVTFAFLQPVHQQSSLKSVLLRENELCILINLQRRKDTYIYSSVRAKSKQS